MRALLAIVAILIFGIGTAAAQDLPEGTFASSEKDCEKLATKTRWELGEDFDFNILTKTGSAGYGQSCDFVNVSARNATSWLATAFCDDDGYIYPDMFAILQKDDGTLAVTRMSDSGSVDGFAETSDSEGLPADDLDPSEVGSDRPDPPNQSDDPAATFEVGGALDTYVRCEKVKEE